MPPTVDEFPAVQRVVVGLVGVTKLFELPQAPSSLKGAEQLASVPPLTPVQVQLKGPDPVALGVVA